LLVNLIHDDLVGDVVLTGNVPLSFDAFKPHPARDLEVSGTAENPTASLLIHLGMNSEAHRSSPLKRTKDGSTSSLQPVTLREGYTYNGFSLLALEFIPRWGGLKPNNSSFQDGWGLFDRLIYRLTLRRSLFIILSSVRFAAQKRTLRRPFNP
jgi:hypothetical protein